MVGFQTLNLQRGIRQGCPLSALLFIIVAEVLSTKLRQSTTYQGIQIQGKHLKVTQLADDMTLFLKNQKEIPITLDIIDNFGKHSGLQLNRTKTQGLWIGNSKHYEIELVNDIKFTTKHIKSLGVYFGNNKDVCINLSWNEKIEKCKQLINAWKKRKLTYFGKITVIKSLLLPKLVYHAQNIITPDTIIKSINTMIFEFLWDGRDKIKRRTIIGNKLDGGIDMPDFEYYAKTLKLKWIKHLNNETNANWKVIPTALFNQFGKNFLIFHMNLDSLKSLTIQTFKLSKFYKCLLSIWIQFKQLSGNYIEATKHYEIRKEILWGNKFIKCNNKSLLFKNWIDSDIIFVNDIISDIGLIDTNIILNKLKNKSNWISEINMLKKAIPNRWKNVLSTSASVNTRVNTKLILSCQNKSFIDMTNKDIYQLYIKRFFEKPYIHNYWNQRLHETINWKSWYHIIHKSVVDNKIKQFKIKLLHNLIPTNLNLFKWKVKDSPLCAHCKEVEDYEHFFIHCPSLSLFWDTIIELFKHCGINRISKNIKFILIGYKIDQKEYNAVNVVLSQISYCIYKTYFISERRSYYINILYYLYYDLIAIQTHFINKKISFRFLDDFVKRISTTLHISHNDSHYA
jgi:hypothetical protein